MRRLILVCGVLAVVTVGTPFAVAALTTTSQPDRYPCTTKGPSDTLARNENGRVYSAVAGAKGDYIRKRVYACNARTGRTFYLGQDLSASMDDTRPQALRRIMAPNLTDKVAWTTWSSKGAEIRQISLQSGRLLRSARVGSAFVRPLQAYNGSLAWIDESPNGTCEPSCTVHLYNKLGNRIIDAGPGIEPDSLARDAGVAMGPTTTFGAGPRLFWMKDGVARTAVFR